MKKLLLIGMLTVAGALNLHAASSNNQSAQQTAWQEKQKTAEGIQDKYQKLINETLKKYGNHSYFIEGYISGFQYNQNNTPEQAVEDAKKQQSQVVENAKKQVKEAKKQYNQALENVTLFTKFSKNSEVTRLMTEIITIASTMSPDTELDKTQMKSLKDSMDAIIGKDNFGMKNLLKTYFVQKYIKTTLGVSPEDIKAVIKLQDKKQQEVQALYGIKQYNQQ